jgi:hypothetical protein
MIYKHGNTSNYLYFIPCKTLYCLQSFINSFYHESFPSNKSNPTMEKAKSEFRKNYNCDLRGMKSGQEDKL